MKINTAYLLHLLSAFVLVIACFMPWTFYPDIQQRFTGFYSYQNNYGKPGELLVFTAVVCAMFKILDRDWARKAGLFLSAIGLSYGIKTFILYTSSYNTFVPQKLPGIYMMIVCVAVLFATTVFTGGHRIQRGITS